MKYILSQTYALFQNVGYLDAILLPDSSVTILELLVEAYWKLSKYVNYLKHNDKFELR